MAEKDKERYIREYMAYQDTDSYKEFMRKKFPGLTKKSKVRAESPPPQQTAKAKVIIRVLLFTVGKYYSNAVRNFVLT